MELQSRVAPLFFLGNVNKTKGKEVHMGLKPGPKRHNIGNGKLDQRQRDNKNTPGNTPGLRRSKNSK